MLELGWTCGLFAAAAPVWSWTIGPWQRAALAAALAAGLCLLLGHILLPWLGRHCPERVANRLDALYELQRGKQATPTMGGLFLIAAVCAAAGLLCRHDDAAVVCTLAVTLGLAAVGLADDLAKLSGASDGLQATKKLICQTLVAAPAVGWWLLATGGQPAQAVPWFGPLALSEGALFAVGLLCVIGTANAVNLTDGLDGLAAGCGAITLLGLMAVMAGLAGNVTGARPPVETPWEAVVLAAAAGGALVAFLWFNRHPARVFMGNTGALACGGLIGAVALTTGHALALAAVGGVFVAETLSVIVQRVVRRTVGWRALHCAPLHHHFQLVGWDERKVVRRFWAAAVFCALAGIGLSAVGNSGAHYVARQSISLPPSTR